ncbi:MAG: homoserine kinase [Candidatus Latescibacteria bacterium]|nr:homoserine kinase [Candidatus Latescibacterota bacterium]
MTRRFCLSAPATSANLGPGFDCLGLALDLRHRLQVVEEQGRGVSIEAAGEGAELVPLDEDNAIYQAMARVFARTGYRPGRLILHSQNGIPLGSGLGSSAAAGLLGLAAGMLLSRGGIDREELLKAGVQGEGHPDNMVPCLVGGITVSVWEQGQLDYVRLEPPDDLVAVAAVPDFALPTRRARSVLPDQVSFAQAVGNQARVGLLVAALATGRLELLIQAMEDVLHQPYRAALVPGLEAVRQAALRAGALGAVLSGAGPTVLALVRRGHEGIGAAMQATWGGSGVVARPLELGIDRVGLQVESA